jgi:pSer/pThr/pTyr-binding forkhead associated (FHA) protein
MVYRPEEEPVAPAQPEPPQVALTVDGTRHEVAGPRALLGRSKECDVRLSDPNVSRRHAEVRLEGSNYWIVDLDSTNGVLVNGQRQKRAKLGDGDRITLGSTEVLFSREAT